MDKHYNIMTSCDANLLRQVRILIYSIGVNLPESYVDFYLVHRGIDETALEKLKNTVNRFDNIAFHDIVVNHVDEYDYIASLGGVWAGEAYYSLCIHEQLPESVDRILYVDAGDLLILGDIAPFYNDDFNGNLILAANIKHSFSGESVVYDNKDLSDPEKFVRILEGTFNSGSYMINIGKLRQIGIGIDFYLDVVETCKTVMGG